MKKLLSLVVAVALLITASTVPTVSAAEKASQTLYKLTAIANYKATIGKFITFGEEPTDLGALKAEDYKELEGSQDYVLLDSSLKINSHGVNFVKVNIAKIKSISTKNLSTGTFLVKEITAGKYKLQGEGRAVRLSNVSNDSNGNKIDYVDVNGTSYITVMKGDFALRLEGNITATKVK